MSPPHAATLLAKDIQTGLKQFLVAALEPADPFMHGLMSRFVEDEAAWLKGPYVQVGLPFVAGSAGRDFFTGFQTEYPGFSHQEHAWQRLSSQHLAANTLVATGTVSGKTECFLYPVLDHCARARQAGAGGIKALVIYPMNALATDQARRIAQLVALSRHDGSKAPVHVPRAQEKAFTQHAVARLLAWLATPGDGGRDAAAVAQLQRNALWLGFLMIPSTQDDKAICDSQFAQWLPRLPEAVKMPGNGYAPSVGVSRGPSTFVGWWPLAWGSPRPPESDWHAPGVVVLDESAAENAEQLHGAWRR